MTTGAAVLALALVMTSSRSMPVTAPPVAINVVIVSVDTLNRSALRIYSPDAEPLPNLDHLGRDAVVFSNAYSTASWTLPAHASLLSGLLPDKHGATDPQHAMRAVTTLAEILYRAGLQTVAFTDGGYVHRELGLGRGFERYNDWGVALPSRFRIPRNGRPYEGPPGGAFDRGVALLKGRTPNDPPLFLFLHTYWLHDYFRAGGEAFETYVPCLTGERSCSDEVWQLFRRRYRARLEEVDRAIGQLEQAIHARPDQRDTLLILLADHGEGLDPRSGLISHGGRLERGLIQVPLLFRAPGLAPLRIETTVSLVDVAPTVLDLLGVGSQVPMDGRSLVRALRGGTLPDRPAFAMEHWQFWDKGRRLEVDSVGESPLAIAVVDGPAFYRLSLRGESSRADLSAARGIPDHIRRIIAARLQGMSRSPSSQLSPRLKEELRALGYVH